MDASCIRVLSIDDHPLVREGIGTIIKSQADMLLLGTASNGKEGMTAFRALSPRYYLDGPSPTGSQRPRRDDRDPFGVSRLSQGQIVEARDKLGSGQ